ATGEQSITVRTGELDNEEQEKVRGAWPELADKAVAQTLPRTVNTGMGALFVLIALAVLGGDSLTDFSIALLVGVVAGMASTVFTAMPIAVGLQHRYPDRPRSRPTGTKRKDRGTGAVV
ncbi:hypothetical protein ACFXPO_34090, partial [Streptomyces sp. NPDC059130]